VLIEYHKHTLRDGGGERLWRQAERKAQEAAEGGSTSMPAAVRGTGFKKCKDCGEKHDPKVCVQVPPLFHRMASRSSCASHFTDMCGWRMRAEGVQDLLASEGSRSRQPV
jgi:hypothetical protein